MQALSIPSSRSTWLYYQVNDGDRLYERYRTGLITRHLCLNGRVEDNIWLRQVNPNDISLPHRLEYNCRWGYEKTDKQSAAELFGWRPLARASTRDDLIPTSWASGENALMTSGLALAAFSLEALRGLSPNGNSLKYAKQIFNFILESEYPGLGGYFIRYEAPHPKHHPFLASLDDVLGICVGLRYFYEAVQNDTQEANRVRSLVSRMAINFGCHGYWILPWSDDVINKNPLFFKEAFKNSDNKRIATRQAGFAYGYAFKCFFRHIAGFGPDVLWQKDESLAYLGRWARPDLDWLPHPVTEGILNASETAEAIALDPLRAVDIFHVICNYYLGNFFAEDNIVGRVLQDIDFFKTMFGGDPLDRDANYFNLQLFSLASILLMECGGTRDDLERIAAVEKAFLYDSAGRRNGLFAAVLQGAINRGALAGSSDLDDAIELAREGLALLTTPPHDNDPLMPILGIRGSALDHDLGLAVVSAELLYDDANRDQVSAITGMSEDNWRPMVRDWNLPATLNPFDRWSGARLWDNTIAKRVLDPIELVPGGTDIGEITRELFAELFDPSNKNWTAMALALEPAGAGVVFARMLASRFGALPPPKFADLRYATLPFLGATPLASRQLRFQPYTNPVNDSRPEREMSALRKKDPDGEYNDSMYFVSFIDRVIPKRLCGMCAWPDGRLDAHNWPSTYSFSKPFRGIRFFRYAAPCRPDMYDLEVTANGFRTEWQYYFEADDSGSLAPHAGWHPPAGAQRSDSMIRFGLSSIGSASSEYAIQERRKISSEAMRPLLRSSFLKVRLCARLVPAYPSVGNEDLYYVIKQTQDVRLRMGVLAADSPFYFVLNSHQGTIHDRRKCTTRDHECGFSRYAGLVMPLVGLSPSDLLKTARTYLPDNMLQSRYNYSEITVNTGLTGEQATKAYGGKFNVKPRSVHLCRRCFP